MNAPPASRIPGNPLLRMAGQFKIRRMQSSYILSLASACLLLCAPWCKADPIWATGTTLMEVIRYDLQAHGSDQKPTEYQTNAVCMLLGYFSGFAESAAIAAHYDATALPFFLPESITNDEIERVVYNFLSANPDKLNMHGGALVVAALAKAFPNPTFKPPPARAAGQAAAPQPGRVDQLSNALISGS